MLLCIYYIDSIYFCVDRAVDDFVDTNVDDGLDDILSQALDMLENKSSKMTENYNPFCDSSRKGQHEHLLMTELALLRYCSNNHLNYCLDCIALCEEKRQDHRFEVGEERSLIDLALESTAENTKKKAMWAFRLYETWAEWRRSVYAPKRMRYKVGDILMLNLELHVMTEEDLNDVLSQFIGEVRKDQGERYPPKTLHELICSVQKYIELKGRKRV